MIERIIQWSLDNRLLVLLLTGVFVAWGCSPPDKRRWTPFPICRMCR